MSVLSRFWFVFQLSLEISLTHSKLKVVSAVRVKGLLDALILRACHIALVIFGTLTLCPMQILSRQCLKHLVFKLFNDVM